MPIFFRSDSEIFEYFRDHRDEIDAITGAAVHIVLPHSVMAGDARDVASALESQERYPGLKPTDLPCFWVESSGNQSFVIKLAPQLSEVKQTVYRLVEAAREATTFANVSKPFLNESARAAKPPQPVPKRILLSLHGIKTRGAWQKELQASCDQAEAGLQHRPLDFGLFGALSLVVAPMRERKIAWFLDVYTRLLKEEQLTAPPSVIAHSFGSYIVAQAMELHPEIAFDRVIVCGSIVRRSYEWKDRVAAGQVARVNDFGRKDIWVRAAEWVIADAGSSGYQGFEDDAGGRVIQRQHPHWRHSDYFYRLNYDRNWIPFVAGARDPATGQDAPKRPINWRFQLFRFGLLVALGCAVYFGIWKHFVG